MAEHLVEAQTIVVRFHGQTPIIFSLYHLLLFFITLAGAPNGKGPGC
jgi:hypothetical protein